MTNFISHQKKLNENHNELWIPIQMEHAFNLSTQVNLSSRSAWSTQNFTTAKDTRRDPVLGGGGNTHKNSNVSCAECSITDQPPCFKYSTGQLLPNEI